MSQARHRRAARPPEGPGAPPGRDAAPGLRHLLGRAPTDSTAFVAARPAARRGVFRRRRTVPWDNPLALAVAVAALLLIATRQQFTVPFTGLGLSPAQLILFLLALTWVACRLAGQRWPAGPGVLGGLILVQFGLTLLSYGLAYRRALRPDQRAASDRTVLISLVAVLVVAALVTVVRTWRDLELVLRALVVGGGLSGAFGVVQYATGVDVAARVRLPGLRDSGVAATELLRGGLVRSQGAAAAPLELGGVLAVLLPLGIGVTFAAWRRGERWWPWLVAVAAMAAGGVTSLSRSLFLAGGAALIVMMTRWSARRVSAVLAAGVAITGAALASGTTLISTVASVFQNGSQDYSLGSRQNGRSYVWTHFAQHYWLGQGPGTYDQTVQPVLDNQYLSQLMESGALGLLLLALVLATAVAYALRATGRSVAPDARELAAGLAGAGVAVLVVESVLDTSGFIQIYSLIWLVIGLSAVAARLSRVPLAARAPFGPARFAARAPFGRSRLAAPAFLGRPPRAPQPSLSRPPFAPQASLSRSLFAPQASLSRAAEPPAAAAR